MDGEVKTPATLNIKLIILLKLTHAKLRERSIQRPDHLSTWQLNLHCLLARLTAVLPRLLLVLVPSLPDSTLHLGCVRCIALNQVQIE